MLPYIDRLMQLRDILEADRKKWGKYSFESCHEEVSYDIDAILNDKRY